ncbi:retrovirus-related pol polyprotein from transposon TNT 1-94 [Tanacetum coccineum]
MDSDKYLEGQSMQRPPLFESDSFNYWKNRFETYVKSKDLDLWHVITNGDFQPIVQNPKTNLKALDEDYSSKNYVRKFLRALHPKWREKVTTIEESKDLTSLSLDELIRNLKVHEMIIKKDSEISSRRVRAWWLRNDFKKFYNRRGRFMRQPQNDTKTFQRSRDEKNDKSDRKCFRCGDSNHLIGECPKTTKVEQKRFCRRLFSEAYKACNGGTVIFGSNLRGQICDNKCRVTFSEHDSKITKDGKVIEPKNVNEALGDESWIVVMQEELNQFIANDVWELVPQARNMTIIGTKWVFRNKLDENGIVSRNKARLVAQGYNQQEGINYDETYALVARLESIRILLAYAYALDFKLFQMDVKSSKDEHGGEFLGELKFFIGLQNKTKMKQMEDGIFFNQSKYIKEMLKKFGREDYKAMKTPMSSDTKLTKDKECDSVDSTKYQGMIGTTHLGLWYPKGTGIETVVYAKSDHAGDYVDRKSTSGICTFMGCCLTS